MSESRNQHSAPQFGALVISLDFEIHWGVRDIFPAHGAYHANLMGVRQAVPEMLRLFQDFQVAGTWATVGFLFARSRDELERFSPRVRPAYTDRALSPYEEDLGDDEIDDPLHYAPSLIGEIRATPRQEIGTHTYSHYYCLAPGQDREAFRADLASAKAISEQHGIQMRSIVFPRNQHNPAYDDVLRSAGITSFRGNPRVWMYRERGNIITRGARMLDAYIPVGGRLTIPWGSIAPSNGLCNVPASLFLRPYSPKLRSLDSLRMRRITSLIERAATAKEIVHLWWHPHNFGVNVRENIAFLRTILETFSRYRESHDLRSLSMSEVASIARGTGMPRDARLADRVARPVAR